MHSPLVSERRASIIGAVLVALGPISLALYTPAMPELVDVFGTQMSTIKLTMTCYFVGFTVAQLVCGPLSDAYGRRPILLWFLGTYLVGSLMAFAASTIDWLLIGRFIQGLGASCGIAVSRAIIRDQFTGDKGAAIMNLIGMMLAAGPAFAPLIGGVTLELLGWEAIFAFMVLYGLVVLGIVLVWLPETNRYKDPALINPKRLAASYGLLLCHPVFLIPALILGLTIGGFYMLATVLPFVLIEVVGLTPTEFGLGMLMQTGCFFLGGVLTRQLMKRLQSDTVAALGSMFGVASGLGLIYGYFYLEPGYFSIMLPVGAFAFANALILPSMTVRGLHPFPRIAGAASAMMGFVQIGVGLLGSAIVAVFIPDPLLALAVVLPGMTFLTAILYWGGHAILPKEVPVMDQVAP
ncbi:MULTISPECIES: multidrug effflux MFS transporter [Pseudovibrio]|uniref:multidrug effflux MFS transporter n=1 Tax=Stappiaceae TaxID=2821832 RepID=UPI0023663C26|nr:MULTISPECIES: multidrug effflux MFS transporter [Pseudovibrio]MDD7909395.1 multidrug effflux MFS transporter [Pseudovibrio exalbescens]MDX5594954.1 multidrug effflux MFS transporter [Pseudovibrio sp. SPO723]